MTAYYNEIDPKAAAWLRELIKRGLIAPGEVDERSIIEVQPEDLKGFVQCHFFAGIGVWSYALRRAGWADNRSVWTGSCPCQPFSAAGKGDEFADERHLWPAWFRLIRECRPVAVFGEQVASKDALAWLDHVSTDLEAEGYAVGAVDTCAAGFGAPHIRQRLYFVVESRLGIRHHAGQAGEQGRDALVGGSAGLRPGNGEIVRSWDNATSELGCVADADHDGRSTRDRDEQGEDIEGCTHRDDAERCGRVGRSSSRGLGIEWNEAQQGSGGHTDCAEQSELMVDAKQQGLEGYAGNGDNGHGPGRLGADAPRSVAAPGPTNGFWANAEWIPCRDGKARPTEPGTFPLVAIPGPSVGRVQPRVLKLARSNRVTRLRGYGNAINAEQARHFIEAYREVSGT